MPKNKSKSSSGRAKRDRATPDSAVNTDHSESSNLLLHHLPSSNTTSHTHLSSPPTQHHLRHPASCPWFFVLGLSPLWSHARPRAALSGLQEAFRLFRRVFQLETQVPGLLAEHAGLSVCRRRLDSLGVFSVSKRVDQPLFQHSRRCNCIGRQCRNFVPYLCQLIFADIL